MNKYFDSKFPKRQKSFRRIYEIDDTLYSQLEELSNYYQATVTDLFNACLENLVNTENIVLYKRDKYDLMVKHTLMVRESNLAGLENLKAKYGVSIYKLVNIAIRNVLNEN